MKKSALNDEICIRTGGDEFVVLAKNYNQSREARYMSQVREHIAQALRRAGHPCELVYYKDNGKLTHAFPALKPDLPESGKVIDQMLDWSKGLGI